MSAPRPLRAHWVVLALLLAALAATLGLDAYAEVRLGAAGTGRRAVGPSAGLADQGPVLDLRDGDVRSTGAPPRTVALTFDDGPDPRWTPAVLDVLRRHGVPATFFVVGARAAAHPDLVRRLQREGHEVASHTFTHVDPTTAPAWELRLQLTLTQLVIEGITGRTSALFRPPYSSTPAAVDRRALVGLRRVADAGYLVVLADRDSRDWRRPGVDRIVEHALPPPGEGAVVLLHDGGGDRSQTVAALDRLLDRLEADGYAFRTVSGLLGDGTVPAPRADPVVAGEGRLLVLLLAAGRALARVLSILLVAVVALTFVRTVLVVVLSRRHHRRRRARPTAPAPVDASVVVLVPAFDEAAGIVQTVRSLVRSDRDGVSVVVIDDGSTDGTAELVEALGEPGVRLVRRPNGGKAAALATGLAVTDEEIVVTVDGDTVFEPATIGHLVAPFADPRTGAVSGNTKVGNRRRLLGRWQHLEYVVGFNLDRRVYEELDCMPTVPGAVGAFRRAALDQVGGFPGDTLAEDTDVTMAVNRAGWHVAYAPRAVAWTEAPSTLGGLWRQRYRWCYGTLQSLWKHRRALRDPDPTFGRRALPYLALFQVLLPMLGPVIDLSALFGLVLLDPAPVLAFWLGFNAVQVGLAAYALRLDGESLRPLWAVPVQQFVYRQVMYLVVLHSVVTALAGVRLPWQRIERDGTATEAREAVGAS